jgi:hypothetical protein
MDKSVNAKDTAYAKKVAWYLVAILAGYPLIGFLAGLPNKYFATRARTIRAVFCERLAQGDKEGALKLFPANVNGFGRLKRFVNLPWRDVQCGDSGPPEQGSPTSCVNWDQRVDVKPKNIADLGPKAIEGQIIFEYSCKIFGEWVDVIEVSPRIRKNIRISDAQSGWDSLNAEPSNHSLDRPAAR